MKRIEQYINESVDDRIGDIKKVTEFWKKMTDAIGESSETRFEILDRNPPYLSVAFYRTNHTTRSIIQVNPARTRSKAGEYIAFRISGKTNGKEVYSKEIMGHMPKKFSASACIQIIDWAPIKDAVQEGIKAIQATKDDQSIEDSIRDAVKKARSESDKYQCYVLEQDKDLFLIVERYYKRNVPKVEDLKTPPYDIMSKAKIEIDSSKIFRVHNQNVGSAEDIKKFKYELDMKQVKEFHGERDYEVAVAFKITKFKGKAV